MFNSLTARAIVPIAISVTGFVVVCCILLYSVMKSDLSDDAAEYENRLADTVIRSARHAMLKSDRETLHNIIDNIGVQEGIEHVRIFNKKGLIMFSRNEGELHRFVDKKFAGCIGCHRGEIPTTTLGTMEKARRFVNEKGTKVLAITAPIYNEKACFTAPCHFHDPAQKILGTLDIGVSTAHLDKTLALMRFRMIVFSAMVLLLTIGGVSALLHRTIFLPLREIKNFTSRANRGNLSGRLTGISGELAELAGDVHLLAVRLDQTERKLSELQSTEELSAEPVAEEEA
ncbi:MAG TPA: HAMP domain-containing protein [Geobacteraceae bacterium]